MDETYLEVKWSVSRGRDTYGYNICTIVDTSTGKKYRCNGGGYDMTGTSFGEWLEDVHGDELVKLVPHQERTYDADGKYVSQKGLGHGFYGLTHLIEPSKLDDKGFKRVTPHLDGACGFESMRRIAEALGLRVKSMNLTRQGNARGYLITSAD